MAGARRYQSYDDSASALPSRSNKSAKLLRHCAAITPKFPNSAERWAREQCPVGTGRASSVVCRSSSSREAKRGAVIGPNVFAISRARCRFERKMARGRNPGHEPTEQNTRSFVHKVATGTGPKIGGIEGTCTQIPINGVISSPRAPCLPQTRAETLRRPARPSLHRIGDRLTSCRWAGRLRSRKER